jgi:hypothetical protein
MPRILLLLLCLPACLFSGATIQIDQSTDPCKVTVAGQASGADQVRRQAGLLHAMQQSLLPLLSAGLWAEGWFLAAALSVCSLPTALALPPSDMLCLLCLPCILMCLLCRPSA